MWCGYGNTYYGVVCIISYHQYSSRVYQRNLVKYIYVSLSVGFPSTASVQAVSSAPLPPTSLEGREWQPGVNERRNKLDGTLNVEAAQ